MTKESKIEKVKKALNALCNYEAVSKEKDQPNFETLFGQNFPAWKKEVPQHFSTVMNAPMDVVEEAYKVVKNVLLDDIKDGGDAEEIRFCETQVEALESIYGARQKKELSLQFSEEDLKKLEKDGWDNQKVMENPTQAKTRLEEIKKETEGNTAEEKQAETDAENSQPAEQTGETLRVSEGKKETPAAEQEKDWIAKKQEWFGSHKENFEGYSSIYPNEENTNEFKVGLYGGTISYSSPNDAVVSEGADFKVYDVLLQDPDNKNKVIEFPQDASEHLTTMLFAAAVLNKTSEGMAHQMNNLDKNKINWEMLKGCLSKEQYSELDAYNKCQDALSRMSAREKAKQLAAAKAYQARFQKYHEKSGKDSVSPSIERIIGNSAITYKRDGRS